MLELLMITRSFLLIGILASPIPFLVQYSLVYLKNRW